jgi:3-keto-disaccharide hydrolase/Protein of unknown function (DUF2961)
MRQIRFLTAYASLLIVLLAFVQTAESCNLFAHLFGCRTVYRSCSSCPTIEPRELFCPGTLAGWDYGATPISGWQWKGHQLSASCDATPLLSGFTSDRCELTFRWSISRGGVWNIRFPAVYGEKELVLKLREGFGCGAIYSDNCRLARGRLVSRLSASCGMHTARLRRDRGRLTVWVDGRTVASICLDSRRRFGLGIGLEAGCGSISDMRLSEPAGKLQFTDPSLADWWCGKNKEAWHVEDGQLVLKPNKGGYLRSEQEYENFVLSLEYKIQKGGNSGIAIRTPRLGWPSGDGMEIQVMDKPIDEPIDLHSIMSIYGNVPPLVRADDGGQERWNQVVIAADGPLISAWVNGRLVQQYNTAFHPELKHRNLAGWIGFQDHNNWARYRNVRIRRTMPGKEPKLFNGPIPMTTASRLTNRLLNSEAVSQLDDGLKSGVATAQIDQPNPSDHVLADLKGPGAVVRFAWEGDKGQLAFYFDDETNPRLVCSPGELQKKLPKCNEDPMPITTVVGYEKSLKIVLRGAKKADYRIDFVTRTDPKGEPTESFVSKDKTGIPRGWLSPVFYRHYVTRWGVHREHDPALRVVSKKKTIAPGETVEAVHVDGTGLVRWVKLVGKSIDWNNLWIELSVDGETTPSISAPAKFWFPGLVDDKSFDNYLFVQRGGITNLLAIPFGRGLSISLKNKGDKPIADIGIDLSVEQATEANRESIAARGRLRGQLIDAGQDSAQSGKTLFAKQGSGRLIGLIAEDGAETKNLAIDSLSVDGQIIPGWKASDFGQFLGSVSDDFRSCLSGRHKGLLWRYLLLAPVEFEKSIEMKVTGKELPRRLVLYYCE